MTKTKVSRAAILTPKGKIVTAGSAAHHKDIVSPEGGQKGFLLTNGKFANRTQAAKIAKKPGVKRLHSSDLEKK